MKRHFDNDLKELKFDILKMATLTEESIYKSIEALKNRNADLAQSVIDGDKAIDELELNIEETAIDLLALKQPIARDLRFITTGMKINAELERIADLTVNISQCVLEIANQPLLKPLIDIPKQTDLARKMVKDVIDAFVNSDEKLAREVILLDCEADKLRNTIQKELLVDYLCVDPASATRAVPLLLIARHLERICDHATNIAEDVIYMIRAKIVKHHPEMLKK